MSGDGHAQDRDRARGSELAPRPAYRVIEPTFEVSGGTPVEALEKVLNDQARDGYHLLSTAQVREVNRPWVPVLILRAE
jgi:hypothetical protein